MSRPLHHALPAGLAAGLLVTLASAGAAAACPAHNPCPASAGGYYGRRLLIPRLPTGPLPTAPLPTDHRPTRRPPMGRAAVPA